MENDQPADASGDVPLKTLVEYFLVYLIAVVVPPSQFSRGKPQISPTVANQYLSHVSKFLLDNLFISQRDELRSDRSRDILRGLARLHPTSQIPWRLRCKIPITYPILLVIIKFIYDRFSRPMQLPLVLSVLHSPLAMPAVFDPKNIFHFVLLSHSGNKLIQS